MSEWFEAVRPERAKRKHDEDDHQAALFSWAKLNVKKYPGLDLMFASMNGAYLSGNAQQRMILGARLKRGGMKKGVPDIFLPVARRNSYGLFIELKSDKGIISPEQMAYGDALRLQGYDFHVCRGWEAAVEVIRAYYNL